MQAIQLGFMPRLIVEHTSASERGQIYMPQVNWVLMLACIGLVLTFRSSDGLAAAYGIAVTVTMLVTTILLYFAAQRLWRWKPWQAGLLCGGVLLVELPLCAANFLKILHGGWFPLVVAVLVFTLMSTWKTGRRLLWQHVRSSVLPAEAFIESIREVPPIRVPGTAVYMAGSADGTPIALLHNLKHNKVLHQRVIFLTILSEEQPRVPVNERITVTELEHGFYRVIARFGFMEEPDVPAVLAGCVEQGLTVKEMDTTYFLSRETVIPTRKSGMAMWRERLFAIMSRNAQSATAFFNLPANRVVELGMQVEM